MKKIINIVLAIALAGGLAVVPSVGAGATQSEAERLRCEIRETGPNSDNSCKVDDEIVVICENNNSITLKNDNDQSGESGDAVVSDNTTGDNAASGAVINKNDSVVKVAIKNTCAEKDKEKEKPGHGAGPVKPNDKEQPQKPTKVAPKEVGGNGAFEELPYTEGASPVALAGIVVAVLGAGALAARLAVMAYGRRS